MNRLKNYKKLEFTKEDALFAKAEMRAVLDKYDDMLKEKMTEAILQSYRNSVMEIERRKLAERAGLTLPRIDHYVQTLLNYSFSKLHRGDRLKALEIVNEIKDELVVTKNIG